MTDKKKSPSGKLTMSSSQAGIFASETLEMLCAILNVPVDIMKHPINPNYRRFNISKKYPRKLKKKLFSTRSRRRKRYYSSSAMYSKIYDRQLIAIRERHDRFFADQHDSFFSIIKMPESAPKYSFNRPTGSVIAHIDPMKP